MKFVHTSIISKNWKELARFYIDVFHCEPVPPERKLSGKWLEKGTGLKDADLEGIHLRLPGYGNQGPTLEIHQYKKVKNNLDPIANRKGLRHIAFSVENVEQTLDNIISNGGKALGEISETYIKGVGEICFVYAADPEGNIIEIQKWK